MAAIGSRYRTGEPCGQSGIYAFDGYTDGTSSPSPTQEERVIPVSRGGTFPPVRSCNKGAYWKLQRTT